MAEVKLPAAFHALNCPKKVPVEGDTVWKVLSSLEEECPGALSRLVDEEGSVKRYMNVYRNDNDIRDLEGLETSVADGDEIWIVPAVAGGSGEPRS